MALISLLAMGVGLGGTLLLVTRFTFPIKRLAAGVARIRGGDYDVQVETISRDELGELTTSFNAMARTIGAQKESLEGSARELEEAYISTVHILAAALDARDNYTLNHSARVATLSLRVGRRLGLEQNELRDLEIACFLHDIGKIRVPDIVLNKPAPLDAEEASLIRLHPVQGAEIIGLAQSLHKYVPVVLHHHEWYDGSGYPKGLQGEDIPLFAQIVAIADAYDAMTSSRPYRPGRSLEEAIEEIRAFRGKQFAPRVADQFIEALKEETEEELSFMRGSL
jgi:HD-GYP domain-containing protein (c-di-GMP phosphodiesterase class II)